MTTYDSAPETQAHIEDVRLNITHVISELQDRAHNHDRTKLESPEKEMFDEFTPRLREVDYGTDEYKASLEAMGPALQHHYEHNRHHPEWHRNGIDDMNMIDLLEMLCDWRAAIKRHHPDGGNDFSALIASIENNAQRFRYGRQMIELLKNTATYLWGPIEDDPDSAGITEASG